MIKKIKEKDIQSQFIRLLTIHGFFVIRHNVVSFHNGRIVNTCASQRGMPDIITCYKGRFIAFEIKTPKGIQSDWQKLREKEIIANGGEYFIVKYVEQGLKLIQKIKGQLEFPFLGVA